MAPKKKAGKPSKRARTSGAVLPQPSALREVADASYGRGSSDASWQVVDPNPIKPWPVNSSRETTDDSSAESFPATSHSPSNLRTGHIERWESQEEIRIATRASRRSWADETSSVASSDRYYYSSSVSTTSDVIDIDAVTSAPPAVHMCPGAQAQLAHLSMMK